MNIIRLGRLTAFQKPSGGVRGTFGGEDHGTAIGSSSGGFHSAFQFAITTRLGSACVAHTIQALCQTDPELTLTSLDSVRVLGHVGGPRSRVRRRFSSPIRPSFLHHLWEDDQGVGEGRPTCAPLVRNWPTCRLGKVVCLPRWHLHFVHALESWFSPCHSGGGVGPARAHQHQRGQNSRVGHGRELEVCTALQQVAEVVDPTARVWRGGGIVEEQQGVRVLGVPGHPSFVRAQLNVIQADHQILLDRIPSLPDVQSSWSLLLHCASARANYHLRVVPPILAEDF